MADGKGPDVNGRLSDNLSASQKARERRAEALRRAAEAERAEAERRERAAAEEERARAASRGRQKSRAGRAPSRKTAAKKRTGELAEKIGAFLSRVREFFSRAARRIKALFSSVSEYVVLYWKPFLVSFALICVAVGSAVALAITIGQRGVRDGLPERITYSEFGKIRNIDSETITRDGVPYLDLGQVCASFGASFSGDREEVRLTLSSGESALFRPGTDEVSINGETVHITAPALFEDGTLLVPLSFVSDYISGVDAGISEDGKMIWVATETADSPGVPGFRYKNSPELDRIPEENAPEDSGIS